MNNQPTEQVSSFMLLGCKWTHVTAEDA
jgi:hypothetical protein